jgi:hypothetical protein
MKQGSNTIEKASTKELLALAIPNAKAAKLASKIAEHKARVAKAKYKAVRRAYKHAKKAAKKAAKLAKSSREKVLELQKAAKRKREKVAPKPAVVPKVSTLKPLPLKKRGTTHLPNSVSVTVKPVAVAPAVPPPAPDQPQAKTTDKAPQ